MFAAWTVGQGSTPAVGGGGANLLPAPLHRCTERLPTNRPLLESAAFGP